MQQKHNQKRGAAFRGSKKQPLALRIVRGRPGDLCSVASEGKDREGLALIDEGTGVLSLVGFISLPSTQSKGRGADVRMDDGE